MPSLALRLAVRLVDWVVVLLSLAVANELWLNLRPRLDLLVRADVSDLLWGYSWMPPGVLVLAFWAVALHLEGLYDPFKLASTMPMVRAILRASVRVTAATIFTQFLWPDPDSWSRFLILAFLGCATVGLVLWRVLFFRVQRYFTQPLPRAGVAIVGVGEDARLLAERLEVSASRLFELRGYLVPGQSVTPAVDGPILGTVESLVELVNAHRFTTVVLTARSMDRTEALTLARRCDDLGLTVLQVPFTWGLVSAKLEPFALGDLQLINLSGLSYPSLGEQIKRGFDLFAVVCGGLLISPLLLTVALAIKLSDGGPVLYRSNRVGKGGKNFGMFKFRSMVPDAEALRAELVNEADGRLFKVADDPRITPIGHFIRKYSIDELPQLLNVLTGEMNLVGPRPLPVQDLEGVERDPEHAFWFEQRSRVNPGITGLWQVAGRSDLPFERMVDLDVHYIQNWSLWLDLQVLVRTVPAVLRGRGAR